MNQSTFAKRCGEAYQARTALQVRVEEAGRYDIIQQSAQNMHRRFVQWGEQPPNSYDLWDEEGRIYVQIAPTVYVRFGPVTVSVSRICSKCEHREDDNTGGLRHTTGTIEDIGYAMQYRRECPRCGAPYASDSEAT